MANKKFDLIRAKMMHDIKAYLEGTDNEVLIVGSQEFSIPVVTSDGDEGFINLKFVVPTGDRCGIAYDGYESAEDYAIHLKAKQEKAEEDAKKKAIKIARDTAERERKKAERERKKAEMENGGV